MYFTQVLLYFFADTGEFKKILGPLEPTGARRKHQILNSLGKFILKLQKHAFVNWSQSNGFFNFNPSEGALEMKYLGFNTLVLTNSKALYSVLKPENTEERYNRHLSFPFPTEDSFTFFSNEGNNNLSSTSYQKAQELFKEEPFWGFYPPKQKNFTNTIKCKSDVKEFENVLKDQSFDDPIFLLLVNTKSITPVEQGILFDSKTNGHFNYLDVDDPSNMMFTKSLFHELSNFITNSKLLKAHFGALEIKNKEKITDPLQAIAPLILTFKGEHQAPLANVDIFFKCHNESAFFMYLTPHKNSPTDIEWVSSPFLKKLYPTSIETLQQGSIEILPNIKPFPQNPHQNRFEQPFMLTASNFGCLNYLDLNNESISYDGDTAGAKSVLAILNYTAVRGNAFRMTFVCIFFFRFLFST